MLGFFILFFWVLIAVLCVGFGWLYENNILLGIGAVMIAMTAMVIDVNW